jgi:molybdate transport system ATP-binding protein
MSIAVAYRLERGAFRLDVEFELPAAGVHAVFGPSGCGKTTLLRAMAGLERRAQGHLRLNGECWQDERVFVPPHRRPFGYVFQEPSLFPHLSVERNLKFGLRRTPKAARRVGFDDAVDLLGARPLLGRRPNELSGGERQRVAIARALVTSPRLLLMDEPLSALDAASKAEILPYLETLHRELETPVFYVSHAAEEVARLADNLLLLDGGRLRAVGPIEQMLTRTDLPLAHEPEAAAVIDTRVVAHDERYRLTLLEFAGGRFSVGASALAIGRPVRLRILARDVSLTLEHQSNTSILNIFPATVTELVEESPAQITVRLDLSGVPMLSRITRKSAETLGLHAGKAVYAQVKSVALLT